MGLAFISGSGKQGLGAGLYLLAYGFLGIPLGLYLTLQTNYGNSGVWLGCAIAGAFLLIAFESIILTLKWLDLFKEVRERRDV